MKKHQLITKQPHPRRQDGLFSGVHKMKNKLSIAGWLAAALFVVVANGAEVARPNVVFLLSDDQGWDDYGFMGHEHIQTPNLDKLAEAGLLYERGYVTDPARYYRILAVPSE